MEVKARTMRVLLSTRRHAMLLNPYIQQLADALEAQGTHVSPWTWRRALFGRYDIVHIHWPEYLVTHNRALLRYANAALFELWRQRLKSNTPRIVRTVHNRTPHDQHGVAAQKRLRWLDDHTAAQIVLREDDKIHFDNPIHVPHGHYINWYASHPGITPEPGRLLYIGMIRPYKNVPSLLRTFSETVSDRYSLHVAGRPANPTLTAEINALAAQDARITTALEYISDEEASLTVARSQCVVMPYTPHNSGVALMALSLRRPILMPDSALGRALQRETGTDWVHLGSPGQLTLGDLETALHLTKKLPTGRPNLTARDWDTVAGQHRDVYTGKHIRNTVIRNTPIKHIRSGIKLNRNTPPQVDTPRTAAAHNSSGGDLT